MEPQHKDLAAGRWFSLSFAEQMGNIGSEVGRTISWRKQGNQAYAERAFARSLELLDLTLSDDRWRGPKRRELARVRESWCESVFDQKTSGGPGEEWNRYFSAFAIMARTQKGF